MEVDYQKPVFVIVTLSTHVRGGGYGNLSASQVRNRRGLWLPGFPEAIQDASSQTARSRASKPRRRLCLGYYSAASRPHQKADSLRFPSGQIFAAPRSL